jgi:hypothetical protein
MSRGLSSAVKTQLASGSFVMAHLVKLELDSTYYYTDFSSDIVDGSDTYSANGFLQEVDAITESTGLTTGGFALTLSGVNQTIISDVLNNGHLHRKITVKRAFLNDSTVAVAEVESLVDFTPTPTADWQSGSHTGISGVSSGSGTGATFNISVSGDGEVVTFSINSSGSGYVNGETITVTDPGNTPSTCTLTVIIKFLIDSFSVYTGRVAGMSIVDTEDECFLEFDVANQWADLERVSGRQTTDRSQQHYFNGDLGFEFMTSSNR